MSLWVRSCEITEWSRIWKYPQEYTDERSVVRVNYSGINILRYETRGIVLLLSIGRNVSVKVQQAAYVQLIASRPVYSITSGCFTVSGIMMCNPRRDVVPRTLICVNYLDAPQLEGHMGGGVPGERSSRSSLTRLKRPTMVTRAEIISCLSDLIP